MITTLRVSDQRHAPPLLHYRDLQGPDPGAIEQNCCGEDKSWAPCLSSRREAARGASVRCLGFGWLRPLPRCCFGGPSPPKPRKGLWSSRSRRLAAQTLDPILEGRPGNAIYQAAMYDSLVGFDVEKGGVGPGVAERWELSDDGLAWTFHLRKGQKFHNGDKLTAHDVKFSLERQMSRAVARLRRGDACGARQEHRGGRRPDLEDRHDQPADRPAGRR